MYHTDSTKMGTKRVFSFQQKLSYSFLQDIRAVRLISFSAKIEILLGFCYIYAHANLYACKFKILKTKNCVPFEVQYTSRSFLLMKKRHSYSWPSRACTKILLAFLSTFWHPSSKCILMCFKKDTGGCQVWKCPKVPELGQRSTECKFLYIRQILAFLSISCRKL